MHNIVWTPTEEQKAGARMTDFLQYCGKSDFAALLKWSDANPEAFNTALLQYIDYRFYRPYERVMDTSGGPPHVEWCVGGTTNVVLNCLDRWLDGPAQNKIALEWDGEDGREKSYSFAELHRETCRLANGLHALGLGQGDVVGLYLPNVPEAVVALLAIAKIGGIVLPMFSGFGADAIAERLTDGGAKAVITVDGSPRRGKVADAKAVIDEALAMVPTVQHALVCRHMNNPVAWREGRDCWWDDIARDSAAPTPTAEMPADAPFLLIYTSGTTGKPKGVVHSHCGFPVKTALDLGICLDFRPQDRILWMSDMGWLVGPILVYGALLLGGTIVLAEGAPNYPQRDRFWRLIQDRRITFLGIAPTIVRSYMAAGPEALKSFDLSSLRVIASTGEPWTEESWCWLFEHAGKCRVPILNFSGGTEVGGILTTLLTEPLVPCVFTGPIPGVGADIVTVAGEPAAAGEIGELVMRTPSIGLTRGLWRDEQRYLDSYWRAIPGMWVHGDNASRGSDGRWTIHGRSDDTLKIAGKRTGPSEIEALLLRTGLLQAATAIGVPDPVKGTAIVCVCVPAAGVQDSGQVRAQLSDAVTQGLGAPFRPQTIVLVSDLPMTRNMKILRRTVRATCLGADPGDLSSLRNPEAVEELRAKVSGAGKPF